MRRLSGHHGRSADGYQEFLPVRRISTEWQAVRILVFAVLVLMSSAAISLAMGYKNQEWLLAGGFLIATALAT